MSSVQPTPEVVLVFEERNSREEGVEEDGEEWEPMGSYLVFGYQEPDIHPSREPRRSCPFVPRVLLFGKPKSGKSNLAAKLAHELQCELITSEIPLGLRTPYNHTFSGTRVVGTHLCSSTSMGQIISESLVAGNALSELSVFSLVQDRLAAINSKRDGYILDDIPSTDLTIPRNESHLRQLMTSNEGINIVIVLQIPDEHILQRFKRQMIDPRIKISNGTSDQDNLLEEMNAFPCITSDSFAKQLLSQSSETLETLRTELDRFNNQIWPQARVMFNDTDGIICLVIDRDLEPDHVLKLVRAQLVQTNWHPIVYRTRTLPESAETDLSLNDEITSLIADDQFLCTEEILETGLVRGPAVCNLPKALSPDANKRYRLRLVKKNANTKIHNPTACLSTTDDELKVSRFYLRRKFLKKRASDCLPRRVILTEADSCTDTDTIFPPPTCSSAVKICPGRIRQEPKRFIAQTVTSVAYESSEWNKFSSYLENDNEAMCCCWSYTDHLYNVHASNNEPSSRLMAQLKRNPSANYSEEPEWMQVLPASNGRYVSGRQSCPMGISGIRIETEPSVNTEKRKLMNMEYASSQLTEFSNQLSDVKMKKVRWKEGDMNPNKIDTTNPLECIKLTEVNNPEKEDQNKEIRLQMGGTTPALVQEVTMDTELSPHEITCNHKALPENSHIPTSTLNEYGIHQRIQTLRPTPYPTDVVMRLPDQTSLLQEGRSLPYQLSISRQVQTPECQCLMFHRAEHQPRLNIDKHIRSTSLRPEPKSCAIDSLSTLPNGDELPLSNDANQRSGGDNSKSISTTVEGDQRTRESSRVPPGLPIATNHSYSRAIAREIEREKWSHRPPARFFHTRRHDPTRPFSEVRIRREHAELGFQSSQRPRHSTFTYTAIQNRLRQSSAPTRGNYRKDGAVRLAERIVRQQPHDTTTRLQSTKPCMEGIQYTQKRAQSCECSEKKRNPLYKHKSHGLSRSLSTTEGPPYVPNWKSPPYCLIFGLPGSGKSILAKWLSMKWNCPLINATRLVQKHLDGQTPIGQRFRALMIEGLEIPDHMVIELLQQTLQSPACLQRGYVLDDFPTHSENFLSVQQQLQLLITASSRPQFAIEVKISGIELRQRRRQTRIDPQKGTLYVASKSSVEDVSNQSQPSFSRIEELANNVEAQVEFYDLQYRPQFHQFNQSPGGWSIIEVDGMNLPHSNYPIIEKHLVEDGYLTGSE